MTPPDEPDATWSGRLAARLGSDADARAELVVRMLHRDATEVAAYWFQLAVAVAIATLGLVLGSTAVVIAAMLVAPLMAPILALGMGLAIGSPVLVARATTRALASVTLAVGGSALITVALPFHDLNAEILARTSPTVLDLLVAACCALAGVYASVRPSPDASTAAGTSIGISLVPPLCASGYGLGTWDADVGRGAALLFLTNFVAIIVVASVGFLATGFGHLDVAALESAAARQGDRPHGTVGRLSRGFGARWVRLAMPAALLAVVWVPLRRALDEVAWEVRVRRAGQDVIGALGPKVVASQLRAERSTIDARLVLLGTEDEADAARRRLRETLERAGGVEARVEVTAVPDSAALRALRRDLATPAQVPAPPQPDLGDADTLAERLRTLWPVDLAGPVRSIQVEAGAERPLVRVVHQGAPLDASAVEVIGRALADAGRPVSLVAVPLPTGEVDLAGLDDAGTVQVLRGIEAASELGLHVCAGGLDERAPGVRIALLHEALADDPRVEQVPGAKPTLRIVDGPCEAPATP